MKTILPSTHSGGAPDGRWVLRRYPLSDSWSEQDQERILLIGFVPNQRTRQSFSELVADLV